jgi:FixJ family two-component response regulator
MGAVAAGYLNKQIAWRLQTAERTVKAQRAKAMEKIGARTTADLVRFAHELARAGLAPERI